MLHFFRKIRHDLISNSQTFKYLKYAIGEVILVVLGILIAIQVNNWNEQKKKDLKKQVYIDRLMHDLVRDTLNLHYYIDNCTKTIKSWRIMAKQIQKPVTTIDTINKLLTNSPFNFPGYELQNKSTYSSLLSIGDIELFHEDYMVTLIDFYAICEYNQKTILTSQEIISSNFSTLMDEIGFSIIQDETITLHPKVTLELDDPKIRRMLSHYLYNNSNILYNNRQLAHYGMVRSKEVLKAIKNPNEPNDLDIIMPNYE